MVKGEEDSSLGRAIFLLTMEHRSYLNVYHNFNLGSLEEI